MIKIKSLKPFEKRFSDENMVQYTVMFNNMSDYLVYRDIANFSKVLNIFTDNIPSIKREGNSNFFEKVFRLKIANLDNYIIYILFDENLDTTLFAKFKGDYTIKDFINDYDEDMVLIPEEEDIKTLSLIKVVADF